jgi:hypothetical protein
MIPCEHGEEDKEMATSEKGPKMLLDRPAGQPSAEYREYAGALTELIRASEPQFSIGIFGSWGSGKTTLMRNMREQLGQYEGFFLMDFNAWRYQREEHLIVPFLDTLRTEAQVWAAQAGNKSWKNGFARASRVLAGVLESLLAGLSVKFGIPKAFELSVQGDRVLEHLGLWRRLGAEKKPDGEARAYSPFHEAFGRIQEIFRFLSEPAEDAAQSVAPRLVIFVDDLDRCLPERAIEVLEAMKLFFDIEGFVFVVGVDAAVIERAISDRYRLGEAVSAGEPSEKAVKPGRTEADKSPDGRLLISGTDYLRKIFQVPFAIPPVSGDNLDDLLEAILDDSHIEKGSEQRAEITERVRPHLRSLVEGIGTNPREIKRFINSYALTRMTRPNLEPGPILALQTIASRPDWSGIISLFYTWGGGLFQALRLYVEQGGDRTPLNNLSPRIFRQLPPSFEAYIQPGGVGSSLFDTDDLEPYLYAGALQSSAESAEYLTRVLEPLTNVRRATERLKPLKPDDPKFEEALKDLASQGSLVLSIMDGLSKAPSAQPLRPILGRLSTRLSDLANLSTESGKGETETEVLDDAVRTVLELTEEGIRLASRSRL